MPTVDEYVHWVDAQHALDQQRQYLESMKPLTMREAAAILAGLRRLAKLAAGGGQ